MNLEIMIYCLNILQVIKRIIIIYLGRRNPKPTLDFLIKRKEDEHFALVKIDEIIGNLMLLLLL